MNRARFGIKMMGKRAGSSAAYTFAQTNSSTVKATVSKSASGLSCGTVVQFTVGANTRFV